MPGVFGAKRTENASRRRSGTASCKRAVFAGLAFKRPSVSETARRRNKRIDLPPTEERGDRSLTATDAHSLNSRRDEECDRCLVIYRSVPRMRDRFHPIPLFVMTEMKRPARMIDFASRILATVYRFSGRTAWRCVRAVFIESNKPPERYRRWPRTPGPAFDAILCGLFVLFAIAYLLT